MDLARISGLCSSHQAVAMATRLLMPCFLSLALGQIGPGVSERRCQPPSELTVSEMRLVYQWNCDRVQDASRDWKAAELTVSEEQKMIWFARNTTAQMLCDAARRNLLHNDASTAATLAIQAWGQHMMNGTACCPLPHAPFCLDTSASPGGYFGFVVCLFGWVLML